MITSLLPKTTPNTFLLQTDMSVNVTRNHNVIILLSIYKVKTENEKPLVEPDDHVKKFSLPQKHLHQEEFVRCVQESGIVKDVATIHRLFDALTDGEDRKSGVCTSKSPWMFDIFMNYI